MTPARRNQNWLPSIFNDVFGNEWIEKSSVMVPAVNILENEDEYKVEMAVAGLTKEDWFSEEICFIECPRVSDNPSVDTYHKLKVALESDKVTDNFVWTNDDIYVLQPIDLSHIQLPKVIGPLDISKYKGFYRENMQRTIDCLNQLGADCQNYGTHTPVMFNKASWLGLIAKLDEQITQGMLYTSIYFNLRQPRVTAVILDWKKDPFLLPVVSQNPNAEIVKSLLPKMFLNNARSGYSSWLENFLEGHFPDKTEFEI